MSPDVPGVYKSGPTDALSAYGDETPYPSVVDALGVPVYESGHKSGALEGGPVARNVDTGFDLTCADKIAIYVPLFFVPISLP